MLEYPVGGSSIISLVGCSAVGALVAIRLSDAGHRIHLLDSSIESLDRIPSGKIESGHIIPIVGDPTSQRDLLKIFIQDAEIFMALSDTDTINAFASEIARSSFQVTNIVCKIEDPTIQETYLSMGIMAIGATKLISEMAVKPVIG